ncbi:MAG: hypothetical protein ACXU8S_16955 [Phenylobacterium sp.]
MNRHPLAVAAALAVLAYPLAGLAAEPAAAPHASLDPRLKLKDGDRYLRDLSSELEIPREEICKELSQYDCFRDAFRIVLGGVDAADLGVNEPLEQEALTAPIALDRVALRVCVTRVERDLADPKHAVLLQGPISRGAAPSPAWMKRTVHGLYDRILARDATPAETAQLLGFYQKVSASGSPAETRVKDWVTLGCFAVASSVENVFY